MQLVILLSKSIQFGHLNGHFPPELFDALVLTGLDARVGILVKNIQNGYEEALADIFVYFDGVEWRSLVVELQIGLSGVLFVRVSSFVYDESLYCNFLC